MRLVAVTLAGLLLTCSAPALGQPGEPAHAASRTAYDPHRLDPETFRTLLAAPLDEFEHGDKARGARDVEALFGAQRARYGSSSIQYSDTINAFAILLYTDGLMADDDAVRRAAVPYLKMAIDAAIAAFGPDDLEVAMSLTDYADVAMALDPTAPPADVGPALERTYRIRRQALGPANTDTASTLRRLARLSALPSRTEGDAAKVDAAAVMFEAVITSTAPDNGDAEWVSSLWADLYVANHRPDLAEARLRKLRAACRDAQTGQLTCDQVRDLSQALRRALSPDAPKREITTFKPPF